MEEDVEEEEQEEEEEVKGGILTMTGMVEALHRICFTRRYLSYRGFMICLSLLVT